MFLFNSSTDCSGFHDEIPNRIKISLDNSKVYYINDTITIRGRVSVNGLNVVSQDSVKLIGNPLFLVSVSKLIKGKTTYNLQYNLNKFKIISKDFQIDHNANCPNNYLYTCATEDTSSVIKIEMRILLYFFFNIIFNDSCILDIDINIKNNINTIRNKAMLLLIFKREFRLELILVQNSNFKLSYNASFASNDRFGNMRNFKLTVLTTVKFFLNLQSNVAIYLRSWVQKTSEIFTIIRGFLFLGSLKDKLLLIFIILH